MKIRKQQLTLGNELEAKVQAAYAKGYRRGHKDGQQSVRRGTWEGDSVSGLWDPEDAEAGYRRRSRGF